MLKSASSFKCLVTVATLVSTPFISSVSYAAHGFACSLPDTSSSVVGAVSANPTVFVINSDSPKFTAGSLVVLEEGAVLKSAQAIASPILKNGLKKGTSYAFELDGKALSVSISFPAMGCGRGACDLDQSFAPVGVLTNAEGVQTKLACQDI